VGAVRDFWEWWIEELKGLRRSATPAFQSEPVLKIGRRTGQILSNGNLIDQVDPDGSKHSGFVSAKKTDIQLLLGQGRYVLRQIAERRLPRSRVLEMAEIDLVDQTPFRAEDVLIVPLQIPSSSNSYYALVRKDVLAPWLSAALPKAGYRAVRLGFELEGETVWLSPGDARLIDPCIGYGRWNQIAPRLASGLLVVLTLFTFSHAVWRSAEASALLETKISQNRDDAIEIRKLLDGRAKALAAAETVRARRMQAIPLARVLEELTSTLPDTTYITDLSLDGSTIIFSGFAQSAAQLIPLVNASIAFESPTLTGPVSRVPGRTGEQFQIRAAVSRP
jgi:general secretion pathway protein L